MKTAGLTTLGYEPSGSLGILFFGWSGSLSDPGDKGLTERYFARIGSTLSRTANSNATTELSLGCRNQNRLCRP
jgi:hypothetical protein